MDQGLNLEVLGIVFYLFQNRFDLKQQIVFDRGGSS